MAQTVCILLSAEDRERLSAVIDDRNRPHKHIQRAKIVLLSAEKLPVLEVSHRSGISRSNVWRWQQRFAEEGVDGLLRDKTRKPGRAPLAPEMVARILALPCSEPPGEVTHWTGRAVAKAVGVSLRAVQRIWEPSRLQPHRLRTFKKSNDPAFVEKVEDVVGLYMNPPAHAVVVSIDEKTQIQALDRTQPGLPLKPGKCGTMTHDYKRNGTTTLFAALNVLDGQVISQCQQRHRHVEWLKFLRQIDRETPKDKALHLIADNYATHKHPNVQDWLAKHPRFHMHFTPTSASWLNMVERFFRDISESRLRRGVFTSVNELVTAIDEYVAHHNVDPKPFIWTKSARDILQKVIRANGHLSSKQNATLH